MLTAQLTPNTFLINGRTFEVDQVIDLTDPEKQSLSEIAKMADDINELRIEVFNGCSRMTGDVDTDLAESYFEFEDLRFRHSTQSTSLLRSVCRRLGGVLPLQLNTAQEPFTVTVRRPTPGESVVMSRDVITQGSLYSRAMGDIEAMLPAFLGTSARPEIVAIANCQPARWVDYGCPFLELPTVRLGLDPNYAKGLTRFQWADHEHKDLDRPVTLGIGRILEQPNRLAMIQNRTAPLPMIAVIAGPEVTVLMNLTECNVNSDAYRLDVLRREIDRIDAYALFLTQLGPLERSGSVIDMQEAAQQPQGITVSVAIRTGQGLIMGGKSWTIQQPDPKGPVSLNTYGVFEDAPGLAGAESDVALYKLFEGRLELDREAISDTGPQCQEEPTEEPTEAEAPEEVAPAESDA